MLSQQGHTGPKRVKFWGFQAYLWSRSWLFNSHQWGFYTESLFENKNNCFSKTYILKAVLVDRFNKRWGKTDKKCLYLMADHAKPVTYWMSLASWWLTKTLGDTHTVGPTLNAYSVTELYLFNYRKGDGHFVTPHLCDRIADPLLLVLLIDLRTPSFQGRFI